MTETPKIDFDFDFEIFNTSAFNNSLITTSQLEEIQSIGHIDTIVGF